MSIFNQLKHLRSEVLEHVEVNYANYNKIQIPKEVRSHCAEFIEKRLMHANVSNENIFQFEQEAEKFVIELISELEMKAYEMPSDQQSIKDQFIETAGKMIFLQDNAQLYTHFINCFAYEQDLLQQARYVASITQSIDNFGANVFANGNTQNEWIRRHESYTKSAQAMASTDVVMDGNYDLEKDLVTVIESLEIQDDLQALLVQLQGRFKICSEQSQELVNLIINTHLHQWNYNRKIFENQFIMINLDTIQSWCQKLADFLDTIRTQLQGMMTHQKNYLDQNVMQVDFSSYHSKVTNTFALLLRGAFIVEVQPKQIIKTKVKFSSTVRLLIRNVSGKEIKSSAVKAEVVSEYRAQEIFRNINVNASTIAEIENSTSFLVNDEEAKNLIARFSKMIITVFSRPGKKADAVTDEKFAFWFQSSIKFGDITIPLHVMSVPVVVVVHGSQEAHAEATIFWDTYFGQPNRLPFTTPDHVTWRQFAEALNQKMFSSCGRGLSAENLTALADKIFKSADYDADKMTVTWTAFCKDHLPGRDFTFWQWFHAAHHLIYNGFRELWRLGFINGFSGRQTVENNLMECPRGTFTLRFSDSTLGGISIAWSKTNGVPLVDHIEPINKSDLISRSLADRISDLKELKILYPDIPKDEAFGRFQALRSNVYNSPDFLRNSGYAPKTMVMQIVQDNKTSQK